MTAQEYIKWFKDTRKEDIALVGGKGANLGEMTSFGIPVPPGFIITSKAYYYFIKENNLQDAIKRILKDVDRKNLSSYTTVSDRIKKVILKAKFPRDLALEIMKAYLDLGNGKDDTLVAVRSSATAEDLPTASFAGQQRTFLNINGESNLVNAVQECYASLFEPRAIFYRQENKFDDFKVGLAVPVQQMIQSDVSGIMFTVNPVTNAKNEIVIEAVWGLGEMIVQGEITPDRYLVNKNSLEIIDKEINKQTIQLTRIGTVTKKAKVPSSLESKQKISDPMILEIARLGKKLHQHYFFPQDSEWAVAKNKLYFVQTRPITTLDKKVEVKSEKVESVADQRKKTIILTGISASPGIATGPVKIIHSPKEINKVKKGDILVTEMTTPDFVPAMKEVVAIITEKGGQTSHAAIVSRELGVPCIVGTGNATKVLKNGQFVTINGKTGEIYKPFSNDSPKIPDFLIPLPVPTASAPKIKTATKIYVNLAEPDLAGEIGPKNVDGIGLARAEFMVAQIGVHPKKLIEEKKQKIFINHLVDGLSKFCKEFNPRPVVYRATDFKTNEYRNLNGGKVFEPEEPNPMLGYRGAYRYISDPALFELELEAIKIVRETYKNLYLMIPFVHVPWEMAQVRKIVASKGLFRSPTFKFWMMVEIPSNVIMLEDFIKIGGIDGVSIGSNDLTMLILGVDRDNSEVAPVFNENDPAVLWALENIIKICHKYKVTCSICGQAPSQYPELVDKLVEWGITSISVNSDVIDQVRQTVFEAENRLIKKINECN